MYTRVQFGKELKERIAQKQDVAYIGHWAYKMYFEHMLKIDSDFEDLLLALNLMEHGPEFECTYEELDKIADDLIAGINVNPDDIWPIVQEN